MKKVFQIVGVGIGFSFVDLALSQDADGGFVSIVEARKIAGTSQYGPNLHDIIKSDYLDLLVPDKILVYRIGHTRNEDQTKKPTRTIGNFAIKSIAINYSVSKSEKNLLSSLKNFDSYGDVPKTVFGPQWAFVFINKDRQTLIVHDPKTRVFVFSELIPDPATGKIWEGSQVMLKNELTEFFSKLISDNEKTYGAYKLTP